MPFKVSDDGGVLSFCGRLRRGGAAGRAGRLVGRARGGRPTKSATSVHGERKKSWRMNATRSGGVIDEHDETSTFSIQPLAFPVVIMQWFTLILRRLPVVCA